MHRHLAPPYPHLLRLTEVGTIWQVPWLMRSINGKVTWVVQMKKKVMMTGNDPLMNSMLSHASRQNIDCKTKYIYQIMLTRSILRCYSSTAVVQSLKKIQLADQLRHRLERAIREAGGYTKTTYMARHRGSGLHISTLL